MDPLNLDRGNMDSNNLAQQSRYQTVLSVVMIVRLYPRRVIYPDG
jgi:hypothetical protein